MLRPIYLVGISCILANTLSAAVPLNTQLPINKEKLQKISDIKAQLPQISSLKVAPLPQSATQKTDSKDWTWNLSLSNLNPEDLGQGLYYVVLQQAGKSYTQETVCEIEKVVIDKNLKANPPITLSGKWTNINAHNVEAKLFKKNSLRGGTQIFSKSVEVPPYRAAINDLNYDSATNMIHFVATNESLTPLSLDIDVYNINPDKGGTYKADELNIVLKPNESFVYDKRYNFPSMPIKTLKAKISSQRSACTNPDKPAFSLKLDDKEKTY